VVDVYLSLPSCLTMVSAAAEIYPDETVGYLVGYSTKSKFIIEYAGLFQALVSDKEFAWIDENRTACINRIINRFAEGMEIVGTFHSHAGKGSQKAVPLPSPADVNHILPDEIQLIVALNRKRKNMPWSEGRYTIYGTVGNLRVGIGGFMKTFRGRGWKRVHINCSGVTGVIP
jgi:proteasome lid subunit RPN8/RPN11